MIAVVETGYEEAVELLLDYSASPEAMAVDDYGQPRNTAILSAARLSHLGVLKMMLGSNADLDAQANA
jgi:ankyrin repeat protein